MSHFKRKVFPNGLRTILVPIKDASTVTVLVLVETGSKYEVKEKNGISHFLEHMCFKGTTNQVGREMMRELDGLGAETNAFTWLEYTGYYTKGQPRHLQRMLEIVSDIYQHPSFPSEEMEKEKGVIIGEINMYEDMPTSKVHDEFLNLLYDNQPAGWTVLGPKEVIQSMKREDFVAYHKKHYVAEATTVVIAGNLDDKKTLKLVEHSFKGIPKSKKGGKKTTRDTQKGPAVRVAYKKTDQTHIILGVRGLHTHHKDMPAAALLASVLGAGMSSRLFERLREEMGAGYYVAASHEAFTDHGIFSVRTGVDEKRVGEVVEAIIEEINKLKAKPINDRELEKNKEYLSGRMKMGIESSDEIAEWYGFQEILRKNLRTPADVEKLIRKVTAKDLQKLAQKIFIDKNLNLAIVGPFKDGEAFKKILKF